MLFIGLSRCEAFPQPTITSVIQAPFARSVLWAHDAFDRVIRSIAFTDGVAENAPKKSHGAGSRSFASRHYRSPPRLSLHISRRFAADNVALEASSVGGREALDGFLSDQWDNMAADPRS